MSSDRSPGRRAPARPYHLFFGLLRECGEQGTVTPEMLREEMRQNHVRHDAFEVLERTPPLEQVLPKAA